MSGNLSPAGLFPEAREAVGIAAIDPRLRLVAALVFTLAMPLLSGPAALAAALVIAAIALAYAQLHPVAVLKRMLAVEGFLVALLVTLPFALPGQVLFSILGLTASQEGLVRALMIVLRVNAALLVVMALLGGLGGQRLASAMTGIGMPATLATLLQLTMRYAATLGEEYRRLRRAMRVRGFRAGSNRHTWRSLGYLVGMMMVRSLERAERVRWAMLCRGYAGRFPLAPPGRRGPADLCFALVCGLAMALLLVLEVQL